MKKLNLVYGGKGHRKDYINIDTKKTFNLDMIKDNSIDEVLAYNVLEHINNYDFALKEIHRVCKHGVLVKVTVPHFTAAAAFSDDHERFFTLRAFKKHLKSSLFKVIKKKLIFNKGFNPLNYFGRIFNLSGKIQMLHEDTFLRNIFIPNNIYFELEIIK